MSDNISWNYQTESFEYFVLNQDVISFRVASLDKQVYCLLNYKYQNEVNSDRDNYQADKTYYF